MPPLPTRRARLVRHAELHYPKRVFLISAVQIDDTDVEEFIEEVFSVLLVAEDESGEANTYHPTYVYSYEQESYGFSYGFELEDLGSYSFEFVDTAPEEGEASPMHSYSFSYSFEYGDHSHSYGYSYEYGDYSYSLGGGRATERIPPNAVQSVTSMDVSACAHFVVPFG